MGYPLGRFTLKDKHMKILANANVIWWDCESGAPSIDCKRPYGNSGKAQICADIAAALGWKDSECPHCGELLGTTEDDAWKLHLETEPALLIVLQHALKGGAVVNGIYENTEKYGTPKWVYVGMETEA